jgi:acetyl esterase/lipase
MKGRRTRRRVAHACWIGVLLVGVTVSACGSESTRTSTPTVTVPSDFRVKSGTCDPTVPGLCSRVVVAQWHDVAYTPVIPCGTDASERCRLRMDITAPTSGGPWPLVVVLPGGPSAPDERYRGVLDTFATVTAGQGAVVMVAGWREGPEWGGGYPTSFQDVACAIGVARNIGPGYRADPGRVTLLGHSTGGWPAAVIGLTPAPFTPASGTCGPTTGSLRPDAVVIEDGELNEVTQPDVADGLLYVTDFLGGDRAKRPGAWAAADPFALAKRYRARATSIPILLVHGSADTMVAPAVSRSFLARLVAAGYRSRLVEIPGADHTGGLWSKDGIEPILKIATGSREPHAASASSLARPRAGAWRAASRSPRATGTPAAT